MASHSYLGALDAGKKDSQTPIPEAKLCRICLGEEGTEEDPFISPCNCSGTMKFIHLNCLREWLANKRTERTSPNARIYSWRNLFCELCKEDFPDFIHTAEKRINVLGITLPEDGSYVIFENRLEQEETHFRYLYIINMENKEELSIGRGHEADVRISDISVSRKIGRAHV